MTEFKRCPECGVPEQIATERQWLNSGVVVQRSNLIQRSGFIESENFDPLYAGIAEIIGIPIDRLIVESTRKAGGRYVQALVPQGLQDMIRDGSLSLEGVIGFLLQTAEVSGYGKCELLEINYDPTGADGVDHHVGDNVILRVSEPYSIAPVSGVFTGACEVVTGLPFMVDYKETSPGVYEIKTTVGDHSNEPEERLNVRDYLHREGDIELEPCPTCGVPKALSGFKWLEDRGIIMNTWTGRRIVAVGPFVLDPLFEELERELGDTIPHAVVEAQRRFIKTGFYSIEEVSNEGDFRTQLALRGMGDLRDISMSAKGMRMRIDNAGCYLMTVGMTQAIFEMAFGVDSYVEWELSEEGDLEVQVTPKK